MKTLIKNSSSSEESTFKPQLTSLIDVMTILLVFLIKSFSVSVDLVTPSKDLVLPKSQSKENAKNIPSIEISKTSLLQNGELITQTDSFVKSDSLLIPELYVSLKEFKLGLIDTTQKKIMIQCDKEVKFNIIKRVMFTSSKVGFADYSVLVVGE